VGRREWVERRGRVERPRPASLGGLDTELRDFTIGRSIGHQHGPAAHGTIFDIGLLGYREIEGQVDGFPAVWTGGVLALETIHCAVDHIMAIGPNNTPWTGRFGVGTVILEDWLGHSFEESWSQPILQNPTISIGL
jgi:hypothetical protein